LKILDSCSYLKIPQVGISARPPELVIPAKAGIQDFWIPASAGMTVPFFLYEGDSTGEGGGVKGKFDPDP
jgi:hypothetical protein